MTIQRRTLFATAAISAAGMTLTGCAAQAAKAKAAAAAFVPPAAEKGSRYPFARVEVLREAVAQYMGGKTDNIFLTHGSAEAIRASIESFDVLPSLSLDHPLLSSKMLRFLRRRRCGSANALSQWPRAVLK